MFVTIPGPLNLDEPANEQVEQDLMLTYAEAIYLYVRHQCSEDNFQHDFSEELDTLESLDDKHFNARQVYTSLGWHFPEETDIHFLAEVEIFTTEAESITDRFLVEFTEERLPLVSEYAMTFEQLVTAQKYCLDDKDRIKGEFEVNEKRFKDAKHKIKIFPLSEGERA